jgi:thiol-disulfide isomerase/thioredoxin
MPPRPRIIATLSLALLLGAAIAAFVYQRGLTLTKGEVEQADLSPEMGRLLKAVQNRLAAGAKTEADFAAELAGLEIHLNATRRDSPEDAAQVLALEASLFLELGAPDRSRALLRRVKAEFPGSSLAGEIDTILAAIDRRTAAERARAALVTGAVFPVFNEIDTAGRPLSLTALRGRVVLIDFWATWCGPCVAEVPNVVRTYEKFHAQGLEIVGVSLDGKGEGATVAQFTRKNGMTWPQYFDGGQWDNKLALKYGVGSIPATYLLDRTGRIVGRDLRGAELEAAITRALAEE